jgi:hypothetical protein
MNVQKSAENNFRSGTLNFLLQTSLCKMSLSLHLVTRVIRNFIPVTKLNRQFTHEGLKQVTW